MKLRTVYPCCSLERNLLLNFVKDIPTRQCWSPHVKYLQRKLRNRIKIKAYFIFQESKTEIWIKCIKLHSHFFPGGFGNYEEAVRDIFEWRPKRALLTGFGVR
jgi:hypothetical protein